MEHDIKYYFILGIEYYQEDKQDFESSLVKAADFLTNGLSNYKKHYNIDISEETQRYREKAKSAFAMNKMNEAEIYFNKLVQISEDDYESKYYKEICNSLNNGADTEKLERVYSAYVDAINHMPAWEDWNKLQDEYAEEFAKLIRSWYRCFKDKLDEMVFSVYLVDNINQFYEYLDLCKIAIEYLDKVMPTILKSTNISNYYKEWAYAWWYCVMCSDYCRSTIYSTAYDQNSDRPIVSNRLCGSLGHPLSVKEPIVKKYDAMCFEVRKFSKNFERCGAKDEDGFEVNPYGFDRLDPAKDYDDQERRNWQTRAAQVSKDKEIDKQIADWVADGGREKEARERRYIKFLSSHPKERTEYQSIKKEVMISEQKLNDSKSDYCSVVEEIEKLKATITEKKSDISQMQSRIKKLEKKIFGKSKAQKEIVSLHSKIENICDDIARMENDITNYTNQQKKLESEAKEIENELQQNTRRLDLFVSNCLI